MTWHKNVETPNRLGTIIVHQLLDDNTHEVLAEVDFRGIVLYADSRAAPMLAII